MNRYRIVYQSGLQQEVFADSVIDAHAQASSGEEVVAVANKDKISTLYESESRSLGEALDDLARLMKARDHLSELDQEAPRDPAVTAARATVESCLRAVLEKMR